MIRVLVVDDSALVRRLVTSALQSDPGIEVVGQAVDGLDALEKVAQLDPDVVTLDIEMPVLDGLAALEKIRAGHPRLPVIMFSTLTERGATKTLDALSRGASDYVTKPTQLESLEQGLAEVRDQLVPKIRGLVAVYRRPPYAAADPSLAQPAARTRPERVRPEVLLVGSSTGGPDALTRLLGVLPGDLGVPVLVVQHMPPVFTTTFAARLDRISELTVHEAGDDQPVEPGHVYIAPGDLHLSVRHGATGVRTVLGQGPQENFCRPSVDVLFRSAAEVYGAATLAVVLTGMGHDGAAGCRALVDAAGRVLVQDEASSVVWGMPGAVVQAGLADEVVELDLMALRLRSLLRP